MNPHPPHPSPSPYPLPPPNHHPPPAQHHDYQQTAQAALSSAGPPPHAPPPLQHQPSQHHIPTPNNSAAPNGRKRKAGQPGSRGVANLTPEQLAKKRANDREAQRAIRERTKNTIEGLEARIRELENQQPYQELQRALADRDRALQECEELRKRLAAVAGIVGNRELGQTGLNGMDGSETSRSRAVLTSHATELAALTAQQSPLPPTAGHSTPSHYSHYQPPPAQQQHQHHEHAPTPQQHLHPDLRSPHNSSTTGSPAGNPPVYHGQEASMVRKWSPVSEPQTHQHYPPHSGPYEPQRSAPPAQMQQQGESSGERLGLNFLLEQQHSSPLTNPKSPYVASDAAAQIINHQIMTCPLDNLLGDFVKSRHAQVAAGTPVYQGIAPEKPSLYLLTHPEFNKRSSADFLSPLLVDILSKFPDIDRLPERIGVFYGMYYLARWFICPCQPCLDRCPPWARPTPEAQEHNHAVWISYLPHPSMRRKLIMARTPGTRVKFDDFFVTFTYTVNVNWPYPPSTCTVVTPAANPEDPPSVDISPAFEEHVRRLESWSLGPEFAATFPELIDETVRVLSRPKNS